MTPLIADLDRRRTQAELRQQPELRATAMHQSVLELSCRAATPDGCQTHRIAED